MKPGSEAMPVMRTGWLWTTSASRDPRVTTRVTPRSRAASSTRRQNVRQRMDGSAPATSTTSRRPSGTRAARISTSGHTIRDIVSSDVRSTRGRVAWKS